MLEILRRVFAFTLTVTIFSFSSLASATPRAAKLTAQDVVIKHLEALGPLEARKVTRSRVALGTAHATYKVNNTSGFLDGQMVFGSVENKVLLAMAFNSPGYTGEKFGFDGKKLTVGFQSPGVRTQLGHFILTNGVIVREGLMGGSLTSAWPLLNLSERGAKVSYEGTDKIEGRLAHKLSYSPNKGSDVMVTLYFDAETFHHVRTQYDYVIAARLASGGVDAQAPQRETRFKMVESFSEHKQQGNLTLPHKYTLTFDITKRNGSTSDKWEVELQQFAFGQAIEENSFNVELK